MRFINRSSELEFNDGVPLRPSTFLPSKVEAAFGGASDFGGVCVSNQCLLARVAFFFELVLDRVPSRLIQGDFARG